MRYINKFSMVLMVLILSTFWSCESFDELNTNPDDTTKANAAMLCTNVVLRISQFGSEDKAFIAQNAIPKYVGYANEGQMNEQYNLLGRGSFDIMTVLPSIDEMLKYAKGSVDEEAYLGVANFAKAYLFYGLTMQMGDIPYSEVNEGANGNYKPKYDKQEDVLIGILDDLELAEAHFAAAQRNFAGDPTPYEGDLEKWERATNAFRLKVLMSLSNKVDVTSLNVKSRFSNIVTNSKLLTEATGFWGLEYSSADLHPLSSTNDLFTSKTCISSLLMGKLKDLNDRRMYYFADPAVAQISAGFSEDDPDAYVGVDVSIDYQAMNDGHDNGEYSLLNLRYLEEYACEPRRLLTFAEQQLILAEARILGWISSGSASNYYREGVTSALTDMMEDANPDYAHGMPIDQPYIDDYFTGEAAFKGTEDEQLKQIWMQRYILNFMQDAKTSYFEYRRNNYPDFPINPETSLNIENKDQMPMRWRYPETESNYNRENLIEALERQFGGYDDINQLMWVLK